MTRKNKDKEITNQIEKKLLKNIKRIKQIRKNKKEAI